MIHITIQQRLNRLRQEISAAVAQSVEEVQQYVQQQPVVGVDETSFGQGNADGKNPRASQGWLWVVVTPLVTFFQVILSRSQAVAQQILRPSFPGTLISDRYGAYNTPGVETTPGVLGASEARLYPNCRTHRSVWRTWSSTSRTTEATVRLMVSFYASKFLKQPKLGAGFSV